MTVTDEVVTPEHPATFSVAVLDRLRSMLAPERDRVGHVKVLDPFAGPGGIHALAEQHVETFGVELQPQWAAAHPDTIQGNVCDLPHLFPGPPCFDVIATSPCYGNRMADHHDAKDPCKTCGGLGCEEGCGTCRHAHAGPDSHKVCRTCKGSGLSHRNSYAHALRRSGVEPVESPENAQLMQWGHAYRVFHEQAWRATDHVLRPGGLVLLNVKNHVRGKAVQRVVEFHVNAWLVLGYMIEQAGQVETKGLPYGANHDARTPYELVVALRKPA